jgi:Protein of unknown function (DUF3800)
MIDAYFDESGIHYGAPFCIVAGYYGDRNRWRRFEKHWTEILRREGIGEFHAKVFFGPQPEGSKYHGWSKSRRKRFIDDLLTTIVESGISPIGCAVVVADWNALSIDQRRFFTGAEFDPHRKRFVSSGCPSKAYFLPFQSCIIDAANHCTKGEKAHFFFDHNKQFAGYCGKLYTILRNSPLRCRDRLGEISLPDGKEAIALQAADLLCFLFKEFLPRRALKNHAVMRSILKRAMANYRTAKDFPFYDAAEFRRQLAAVDPPAPWSVTEWHI